jgi:hypothetical protein
LKRAEFSHCGLRAQILQLLEADDLVGVQALAARNVARCFFCSLPRLLDLGIHFCLLDLGELLALADLLALDGHEALDDAADLEGEANLVLVGQQAVGADRRRGRSGGRDRDANGCGLRRLIFRDAVAAGRDRRAGGHKK